MGNTIIINFQPSFGWHGQLMAQVATYDFVDVLTGAMAGKDSPFTFPGAAE